MHNLWFLLCFFSKITFTENYFQIAAIYLTTRGPLYTCLVLYEVSFFIVKTLSHYCLIKTGKGHLKQSRSVHFENFPSEPTKGAAMDVIIYMKTQSLAKMVPTKSSCMKPLPDQTKVCWTKLTKIQHIGENFV